MTTSATSILPVLFLLLVTITSTGCWSDDLREFEPTAFHSDTIDFETRQMYPNPNGRDFLVVYFAESRMSFGSGHKLVKLYNGNGISVGQCLYGAFPLKVVAWSDSVVKIVCGVDGRPVDSTYTKWYLDHWVDQNPTIGEYRIEYTRIYDLVKFGDTLRRDQDIFEGY